MYINVSVCVFLSYNVFLCLSCLAMITTVWVSDV